MSYKVIAQNYGKVIHLPKNSRSLSQINAYTDQALMNLNYETMSEKEFDLCLSMVAAMMRIYRRIKKA